MWKLWPHPAKSRGLEAMRETWLAPLGAWDDFRARPDEVIDHGDNVLVRDGKIVRLALYWDTARAREAAAGRD